MNVVSLFANIGIGEAYLKSLGFNVVVANELEPRRAEIYRQIYPETEMICGDITNKDVYSSIVRASKKQKIDVIMATPPCQGMSTAGKQDKFDVRNDLFLYAIKLIKDVKPDYFIFENVPGFMTTSILYNDEPRLIPDVIKDLLRTTYTMSFNIVDTQDYGVPIRLIDFLSDHRNLFTQIHKINNSGRAAIDWNKTIRKYPYIKESKPYYLDLQIKDKAINIDEELIILYYSVLRYLKDKFHFPITLGDIPYELLSPSEIQRYLDTGVGKRKMRDIKGKYFRDDLRTLWNLLDAFFTFNYSRDDKCPRKEALAVKEFDAVFEKMVDRLIGDTGKLAALKNQKDGKLIDHIYMDKSLIGKDSNIYYIGDSKYYSDSHDIEGVPLYKQFTYARNAIQYNIDQYYLKHKANPNAIRYRDKDTEGYNVTPNFFVRPKIKSDTLDFDTPSFSASGNQPKPNKHFEDRLFDRDTLLLREYEINLIFLIAAYGSYEDHWATSIRATIREDMLQFLTDTYAFFKIQPMDIPVTTPTGHLFDIPFLNYFHNLLAGKVYKESDDSTDLILAFEKKTEQGKLDLKEVQEDLQHAITGGSITDPIELKP